MFTLRSLARRTATAACAATALFAASAPAVTITVGSYANTGIGAEFASSFDNFTITGETITLAPSSSPTVVSLGTYTFEVGPNCWSCSLTPSFDALIDVTIDGLTRQLGVPYAWYSSGPSDFLTFSTPAPVLFDFGALGLVTVAVDAIGTLASSGEVLHGNVTASVTLTPVPEPDSYALMLAGFGVVALVARRRRR